MVKEDGTIDGYDVEELNIDNVNAGKLWTVGKKALQGIYGTYLHVKEGNSVLELYGCGCYNDCKERCKYLHKYK